MGIVCARMIAIEHPAGFPGYFPAKGSAGKIFSLPKQLISNHVFDYARIFENAAISTLFFPASRENCGTRTNRLRRASIRQSDGVEIVE
jgi:hypothetical protein